MDFPFAGVVTLQATLQADVIVLAAGCGIPALTKQLGLSVPLIARPSTVVVITKPIKPTLKHMVVTGMLCKNLKGQLDTDYQAL